MTKIKWFLRFFIFIYSIIYGTIIYPYAAFYKILGFVFLLFLGYLLYLASYPPDIFKKFLLPYSKLYYQGKLRGMWNHESNLSPFLNQNIEQKLETSENVRLKISRGYRLFVKENEHFYKFLNKSTHDSSITMKVLLLYPCMESAHVIRRASINSSNPYPSNDEIKKYVDCGLMSLMELFKKHLEQNDISIEMKYYHEKNAKWRYYLFDDDLLYLAYYDGKKQGIKKEMYKIEKGNNSLCEPFIDHFEDIWTDESSIKSIDFIKDHYAINDNGLTKCSKCQSKETCNGLKDEYLEQIKSIETIHSK